MWSRNKKSWRIASALCVSVGIHALALLGMIGTKPNANAPKPDRDIIPRNAAVRVLVAPPPRITPSKVQSAAPVKRVNPVRTDTARKKILRKEISQTTQVAQKESVPQSNSSAATLFPSNGALARFLPNAITRRRWQEEGYLSSSEGRKSDKNAAEQVAAGAKLSTFGERFEEHFLLPQPLRQYTILAHAEAEVIRVQATDTQPAQWQVWTLRGEPYFRALLYESLVAFLPSATANESLKEFQPSRFVVALNYEKSRSNLPRDMEHSKQFFGMQFTLILRDFEVEEKWAIPQVSMQKPGTVFTGINLLGSLGLLAKKVAPVDPFKSSAMETLRRSPGFSLQGNIQSQLPGR
jgi:hypothetical protein